MLLNLVRGILVIIGGALLTSCVTTIDPSLPYDQLPEINLATDVTLVASPSHPASYLSTDEISAGTTVNVLGQDENAAWLLVEHSNTVGWVPSFYSQTNIGTLDSAFTFELLPDDCTKFMGTTTSPTEAWTSTAPGTITVGGSILHSADADPIADLALQVEIDGLGQAVEADYVHTMVGADRSVIFFGFTLTQIDDGSEVRFGVSGDDQIESFQAAFFINTCAGPIKSDALEFTNQLPIGQPRTNVIESSTNADDAATSTNDAQLPSVLVFSGEPRSDPISSPVESLAWSPDGTHFAAGTEEGVVGIWRADDGALVHSLEGHFAAISVLELSPNGRHLASGSKDGVIRV